MSLQIKTLVLIFFSIICGFAQADAFVCVDKHGKKVFVTESCEKKGMKFGSHDFPVESGQAINAVIIAPYNEIENGKNKIKSTTKNNKEPWNFREGTLKISPAILVFLLLSLLSVAVILSYQVYFYFKSNQEKLIFIKKRSNK